MLNYFNNSSLPPVTRRGEMRTHIQILSFHSLQRSFVAGGELCYTLYVCRLTCCTARCLWEMGQLIASD